MISWGQCWKWGDFCMRSLPLKFSHYPSRSVPVPGILLQVPDPSRPEVKNPYPSDPGAGVPFLHPLWVNGLRFIHARSVKTQDELLPLLTSYFMPPFNNYPNHASWHCAWTWCSSQNCCLQATFSTELLATESAPREDNYKEKHNIAPAWGGKWGKQGRNEAIATLQEEARMLLKHRNRANIWSTSWH